MKRCRYLLGRWVCRHGMIDQLIYQYLRMCVPPFRAREGYRLTVSEVHVLGTSLSLYLLARIPPSERERFHGLVFWFGKRRILTTYLTLPLGCPFFSRHENGCDKTTSLSLLLFTFCHLNQLGIIVLVQLQI